MTVEERRAALRELVKGIRLVEIRALSFAAEQLGEPPPGGENIDIDIAPALGWDLVGSPGEIVLGIAITVEPRRSGEQSPYARFTWNGQLRYSSAIVPSAEVAEEFGRTSGVPATWPYAREFVQSSCARLMLPVVMLPALLNVPSDNAVQLKPAGKTTAPAKGPESAKKPT